MEQKQEKVIKNENQSNGEKKEALAPLLSTKMIAGIAIFTALSYGISFLEFSLFPASAVAFLKLDFSNVFIMLAGFTYGPIAGLIVGLIKELLCLIGTSTFGIGQIANFLVVIVYVLPPAIVYRHKKGIKTVIIMLIIACVLQISLALLVNKFITFPLYGLADLYDSVFWLLLAFNAIKSISISVLTIILYKRVSSIIKRI